MWFLLFLLLSSVARCHAVNFQDHFRVLLRNKTNPCEGHVEVYYNNELGYVGDKYWDRRTEAVVCRSTQCGEPLETTTSNVRRSMKHKVWLNELRCDGTERNLWDCPGWPGPAVSFYQKPTVKRIKCSDTVQIKLKQHKCEGAVQFIRNNKAGYICSENFGEEDASKLCETLECGVLDQMLKGEWMNEKDFAKSEKMMLNCSGIRDVTNLWQCVRPVSSPSCQHPASISCTGHEKLQLRGAVRGAVRGAGSNVCSGKLQRLKNNTWETFEVDKKDRDKWCKQMHCGGSRDHKNQTTEDLTCSESVKVVLMEDKNETTCYGEVYVNVSKKISPVCGSDWGDKEAEMVCKELNCGKMLTHIKITPRQRAEDGIMDHVKCDRDEASLWHCRAKHGKNPCSSVPKVFCAKSMDVKLVDGPGRCSGRLEVFQEGKWKQVSRSSWTEDNSNQVCKQLGCGEKIRANNKDKFKKGAGDTLSLQCSDGMSHISECKINSGPAGRDQDPVGITCDEHQVVFLDGPGSCSGRVGMEQGHRNYWLSGSEETWNQEAANAVCQQLHCGKAENFTSESYNDTTPVWDEVYSCSAKHTSLFECKTTALPADYNMTVANVMCTGQIKVSLTNGCWGFVTVSAEGRSGGIYAETWTEDMSKKLCNELKCGDKINPTTTPTDESNIIWKSLHARSQSTPLNKYTLVQLDSVKKDNNKEFRGSSAKAYVVCKGSVKPRFGTTRDKCSGNIEIHQEGKWLPVLRSSDTQTPNTICNKLNCGDALGVHSYFGPKPAVDRVVSIKCSDKQFSACDITHEKPQADSSKLGALQCSDYRKIALEVDYACKGEVSIYSKDTRSVVSSQNWTKTEGARLCQDLNCGNFKSHKSLPLDASENVWRRSFKCSSDAKSIWECEQDVAPSELNNKLYIECGAEPDVTLSGKCAGVVKINGDEVCDSQWQPEYSHRVCQELNCGNAISALLESSPAPPRSRYHHVRCDEHNYIIGQCHRVKGECQKKLTISCTDSVSFSMTGNCNGYITINYQNKKENLCKANVSEELLGNVCRDNDCGAFQTKQDKKTSKANTLSVHCPSTYKNMRYCVAKESTCTDQPNLHIECEKSVQPTTPPPPAKPINPVPILVGVGIVLILVILIVIFIRYRIIMRNRKARVASNMLPEQEREWESGEYEDVDKSDEIEDFNQGFRSESEIKKEKDVESNASFSYDDIDEVAEARPLTSPGSTDDASKNKAPNPKGVTYEVDDSQENYDDIDASSEAAQTRAEVHDGPQTSQKTDEAALQEPVQKDEDYLVPGQDG